MLPQLCLGCASSHNPTVVWPGTGQTTESCGLSSYTHTTGLGMLSGYSEWRPKGLLVKSKATALSRSYKSTMKRATLFVCQKMDKRLNLVWHVRISFCIFSTSIIRLCRALKISGLNPKFKGLISQVKFESFYNHML